MGIWGSCSLARTLLRVRRPHSRIIAEWRYYRSHCYCFCCQTAFCGVNGRGNIEEA
ncbi:hypothetical protein COCVIDRAFT_96704 [Bipolaris victoriae FI3]|uniref:Uncharacterized protein n=1 Tax=Bipolaris victoriae (strain FI3) TaxID=930091 RepID=W7EIU6_BIPV3|nr:hypothetical protein COCVIDRAFT_96704 [Bipolaris victoriae FI3]